MMKLSSGGRLAAASVVSCLTLAAVACSDSNDTNANASSSPAPSVSAPPSASASPTSSPTTAPTVPPVVPNTLQSIRHVFVITLENQNYATTFAADSQAPYLSKTLVSQGALLEQYFGTSHVSLGNYIGMLSGQSVTMDTQLDCMAYKDMALTGVDEDGQAIGTGCVYPSSIKTLPDQLKAVNLTWKGYMEDMGNDPARESATCGHPVLGAVDGTQSPQAPSEAVPAGDQYATRHNPFAYFHSIIDSADCNANVVNLTKLTDDLKSIDTTANFTFITRTSATTVTIRSA